MVVRKVVITQTRGTTDIVHVCAGSLDIELFDTYTDVSDIIAW